MYSKEEKTITKSDFWITFGKYMSPVPSVWGTKTNWINYRTEVKGIELKMDANGKTTRIAIIIKMKDAGLQALFYEQFLEFKLLLHAEMEEEWTWQEHFIDSNNNTVCSIHMETKGNIYSKDAWGDMFGFLKTRLIAFDVFWSDAKDIFKDLES